MPGASQVLSIGQESIDSLRNLTEPSPNTKLAPPGCMLEAASTGSHQQPPRISPAYFRWLLSGYSASKYAWAHQLESHHIPTYCLVVRSFELKIAWARSENSMVLLVPSVTWDSRDA